MSKQTKLSLSKREGEVLEECARKLENLQDELRGACRVTPIINAIQKRIAFGASNWPVKYDMPMRSCQRCEKPTFNQFCTMCCVEMGTRLPL